MEGDGTSAGCEPETINVREAAGALTVSSPAAHPPHLKIEMIQPKVEMVDFDEYSTNPDDAGQERFNENDDDCDYSMRIVTFKCFHCSQETKWKRSLQRHIETLHLFEETQRQTCPGCGKSLKTKESFKSHAKYCEKMNRKVVKHKCSYCFYESKWRAGLKSHMKRIHPVEMLSRPICTACGRSCENESALKSHFKYCGKLNNEIMKYKCFHCSHKTKHKHSLKCHIETRHLLDEIERPTCHGCGKSLKTKFSLTHHMRFCEKINTKIVIHKCPSCSYKTKWKGDMKVHIRRIHSEETTDICPGCGKCYKNSDCLRQHMRHCDKSDGQIVKHKCSHCFYETKWKSVLTEHMRRSHSIETTGPFNCTKCGKSFKDSVCLRQHTRFCEKSNKKVEKRKCSHCSYETKWSSTLTRHLRNIHSVEMSERITCTACGKSLKHKDSLRKHMKYCEKLNNNGRYTMSELFVRDHMEESSE